MCLWIANRFFSRTDIIWLLGSFRLLLLLLHHLKGDLNWFNKRIQLYQNSNSYLLTIDVIRSTCSHFSIIFMQSDLAKDKKTIKIDAWLFIVLFVISVYSFVILLFLLESIKKSPDINVFCSQNWLFDSRDP